jgi:hypothetical protein
VHFWQSSARGCGDDPPHHCRDIDDNQFCAVVHWRDWHISHLQVVYAVLLAGAYRMVDLQHVEITTMNQNFTVKWQKQRWEFKVATPSELLAINSTLTYHGKVENVYFLVYWNRRDATYKIQWDDMAHTGTAWFSGAIAEAIQTIMADRAGFTMYERYQNNYPTTTSSTPTKLFVGRATVCVVRYTDNSRWWYETTKGMSSQADWVSKFFKPDIQPSKEHLLKQLIKGNFAFYTTAEGENND